MRLRFAVLLLLGGCATTHPTMTARPGADLTPVFWVKTGPTSAPFFLCVPDVRFHGGLLCGDLADHAEKLRESLCPTPQSL